MENTAHYTISALLMLKQYAKHAEYALVSVSDVVDEVVVVIDDDADDATIDLARRFASKVVHVVWTGFGEGLNRGIDECSGDWILRLDSDEIVSKSSLPLCRVLSLNRPRVSTNVRDMSTWPHTERYVRIIIDYSLGWEPDTNSASGSSHLTVMPILATESFPSSFITLTICVPTSQPNTTICWNTTG